MRIALDHLDAAKREISDRLNRGREELRQITERGNLLRIAITEDEQRLGQLTRASQILLESSIEPAPTMPDSDPPPDQDAEKVSKKRSTAGK